MEHKTKSMYEAAALMSQKEFNVFYLELRPTSIPGRYEFVYQIDSDEGTFGRWKLDYMNKKVCVEPKTYDSAVNSLRDILNMHKPRR